MWKEKDTTTLLLFQVNSIKRDDNSSKVNSTDTIEGIKTCRRRFMAHQVVIQRNPSKHVGTWNIRTVLLDRQLENIKMEMIRLKNKYSGGK